MKTIEVDDDLYHYIASQTQQIGESASSILRRLLLDEQTAQSTINESKYIDLSILMQLVNSKDFFSEKKQVNRFLLILMALYQGNRGLFSFATTSLHGSKRRYLAEDEETLLQFGNATKPKQIPDTPYWVITNTNAARKVYIIESIMQSMGIDEDTIETVKARFEARSFSE